MRWVRHSLYADKEAAWGNLESLTRDHISECEGELLMLGAAFQHIADKETAWTDLQRLTYDQAIAVRVEAAYALGAAFQHIAEQRIAWTNLQRLTGNHG